MLLARLTEEKAGLRLSGLSFRLLVALVRQAELAAPAIPKVELAAVVAAVAGAMLLVPIFSAAEAAEDPVIMVSMAVAMVAAVVETLLAVGAKMVAEAAVRRGRLEPTAAPAMASSL